MSVGKVILVVLATLVIFSTGLITGVVLSNQFGHKENGPPRPQMPDGPPWRQFLFRVQEELDLTPEQRQRIASIMRDSQERTRGLVATEFRKIRQQIQAELTPAQKDKFDQLLRERQRRMQEMRRSMLLDDTNAPARPPDR